MYDNDKSANQLYGNCYLHWKKISHSHSKGACFPLLEASKSYIYSGFFFQPGHHHWVLASLIAILFIELTPLNVKSLYLYTYIRKWYNLYKEIIINISFLICMNNTYNFCIYNYNTVHIILNHNTFNGTMTRNCVI